MSGRRGKETFKAETGGGGPLKNEGAPAAVGAVFGDVPHLRSHLPRTRALISVGDMYGIRVYGVQFVEFLGPVLSDLDRCFVYAAEVSYPPALLRMDDEAEAREQARIDREMQALSVDPEPRFFGGVFRPGFLGRLGCCVRNDWNDLLLFRDNPDWRELDKGWREAAAGPNAPMCVIQNWDGSFWQLFAEDDALLATLRTAHEAAGRHPRDVVWDGDQPDPVLEAVACRAEDQRCHEGD